MAKRLGLELVQDGGSKPLLELGLGRIILGREPEGPGGLIIPGPAVSRNHAEIKPIRLHWFFSDLGSTNGSWVNGKPIPSGYRVLLRPNDVLQLADVTLRLTDLGGDYPEQSALIFQNGECVDEIAIPETGTALSVGGADATVTLDGVSDRVVTFERRGKEVIAQVGSSGTTVLKNGVPVTGSVPLMDRDELVVQGVIILMNLALNSEGSDTTLKSWDSGSRSSETVARSTISNVFGMGGEKAPAGTIALKKGEIESMVRRGADAMIRRGGKPSLSSRERILIGFIFFNLFLTVILLFWVLLG
jgi:hypothetical protein